MATQGTNDSGSNINKGKNAGSLRTTGYQGKRPPNGEARKDARKSPRTNVRSFDNRGGKTERFDKGKNYNSAPRFSGKDDDDDEGARRNRPSRPKESKTGVSIPDKSKIQLRLEKEQKSMKKKQQSKRKESTRPQPRVKRSNNVNYTKNYANGDYDDYEDYYDE